MQAKPEPHKFRNKNNFIGSPNPSWNK